MNLEQFTEKIAVDLQTTLPHKYAHVEVRSRNVKKIGGSYLGIELKPEGNIGPLLEARKYYEEYMHGTPYFYVLNLIVNNAVDALDKIPTKLDIDLNKLEENIFIQVVQTESNKEYLEKIPHLEIEDLSIICRFNVEISANDEGSIVISDEWLDILNISEEELLYIAKEHAPINRPVKIQSMNDVIHTFGSEVSENTPKSPLVIVTNESGIDGASVLFYPGVLERCADILNGNFYILPSSLHEFLILGEDETVRAKELKAMVKDINDNILDPEEFLSNNVYHYDWKEKVFEIADKYEARMKEKAKQSLMENLESKKHEAARDGHLRRNQDIGCRRTQGGSLCL